MSQVQFSLLGLKYIASSPPSMYCTFLPLLLPSPSSPLPLVFFSPPPFLFLPNFLSFSFSSYSSPLLFIPLPSLLSLFFLLLLPSFSLPPQLLFPSPLPPLYSTVVLVVSSIHPSPLEAFSQLYTQQKESERSKYPKWLTPHLLYYYILLHDVSEGNDARYGA